jgi:ABC-type transport system involved in cytochrome c biogenesis permease subunit
MVTATRNTALRIALVILGVMCLALGPLMLVWPSGWRWTPYHAHYEQMIVGIYFTLGIFLLRASKDPLQHLSIIWFAVWASVVHASIMTIQSLTADEHHGHLVADVPALFLAAIVLSILTPRRQRLDPPLPMQST